MIHTASPYSFKVDDPVKDFLDPAIKGTTGILKSAHAYGPGVKRIVLTSSSAAIVNPWQHEKVYDESKWSPFTWEDAQKPQNAYPASKVSARAPLESYSWSMRKEPATLTLSPPTRNSRKRQPGTS